MAWIHQDLWRNSWRVIAALWNVRVEPWIESQIEPRVERAWNWYARWARRLVRAVLVIIVGQPIAVVFVSLTGVHEFTAFVALTPIVALVLLIAIFIWLRSQNEIAVVLPAGIGAAVWDRTGKGLSEILRGLAFFLFIDLVFGLYFSLVPVENDRKLVLWILIAMALFILARAALAGRARKWVTTFLVLFLGALTLVLLNGGWGATKKEYRDKAEAKAATAEIVAAPGCPSPNLVGRQVTLQGLGEWASTGVDLSQLPGGLDYEFYGPSGTRVRFVDQSGNLLAEGLISQDFGVQGGIPELTGEAGRTATLCVKSN